MREAFGEQPYVITDGFNEHLRMPAMVGDLTADGGEAIGQCAASTTFTVRQI